MIPITIKTAITISSTTTSGAIPDQGADRGLICRGPIGRRKSDIRKETGTATGAGITIETGNGTLIGMEIPDGITTGDKKSGGI
jgi:hypothetical protein